MMGEFVKTSEHTAKTLDLVDERFDHVSLPIQPAVILALGFRPLMRRNNRRRAGVMSCVCQPVKDTRNGLPSASTTL